MQTEKKWSVPLTFLLPLCAKQRTETKGSQLEYLGAHSIFDRNVIGVVAQFLVGLGFSSHYLTLTFADRLH